MSYVECMECREKLKYVAPAHLEKHGLTSKQYRKIYPTAPMQSSDLRKRHSDFRKGMRLNRNCRKCGRPFTTGSTNGHYCRECQKARTFLLQRKASRRYERRKRNSAKFYEAGTFNEGYLKIVNGRVRGTILLEANISINTYGFGRMQPFNGRPPFESEETCIITIYLIVWKRKPYCGECGSELTVARENGYYTIPAEIVCPSCGLVYEDRATIKSGKGRIEHLRENIWLPRYVRRDPSVKETFGTTN